MSTPRDPWSDPATETEPGAPYAGPPPTTMPYWATPAGPAPYAAPWPQPWAQPWPHPWPPAPVRPQRPGQVVAAAVLAFVQAAAVALTTAYVQLLGTVFAAAAEQPGFPADGAALAAEADVLSLVQLVSVLLLVAAGVLALATRRPLARWVLGAALALQLALAAYWAVRLLALAGTAPALLVGVLAFAAAPTVALGLSVGRPARAWFAAAPDGGTTPHR